MSNRSNHSKRCAGFLRFFRAKTSRQTPDDHSYPLVSYYRNRRRSLSSNCIAGSTGHWQDESGSDALDIQGPHSGFHHPPFRAASRPGYASEYEVFRLKRFFEHFRTNWTHLVFKAVARACNQAMSGLFGERSLCWCQSVGRGETVRPSRHRRASVWPSTKEVTPPRL